MQGTCEHVSIKPNLQGNDELLRRLWHGQRHQSSATAMGQGLCLYWRTRSLRNCLRPSYCNFLLWWICVHAG